MIWGLRCCIINILRRNIFADFKVLGVKEKQLSLKYLIHFGMVCKSAKKKKKSKLGNIAQPQKIFPWKYSGYIMV